MSNAIRLPNNGWTPRPDQLPFWTYLMSGGKRALQIAHRRWGKDDVALHATACKAMQRPGNYWHMLPEFSQARKAVWDAVNPRTGLRRIDEAFPEAIRKTTRNQEMYLELINGASWQLIGSDNFNSLVGSPPVGLVFSEFALADPRAWGYLRPILAENGGWAAFISTTRGKNHLYKLYQSTKDDPDWFTSLLTIEDTGLLTPAQIAKERLEYISMFGPEEGEALFRSEWYCSFETAVSGSYYGPLIVQAEDDKRVTNVPYDPLLPVYTAWDLGIGDATGIWFIQVHNQEIRVINYYEASGEGMAFYAKVLKDLPYNYAEHVMPHDIRVRELGTGKTRYEQALALGIRPITVAKKLPVDDGINAVRALLPRMWFDKTKCADALEKLKSYHKEWDDVRKEYKNKPFHDFSSHAADAVRYFATGYRPPTTFTSPSKVMERNAHMFKGVW